MSNTEDLRCRWCGLPTYTSACRCNPAYILGSCTESACTLCRTPLYHRRNTQYHTGKPVMNGSIERLRSAALKPWAPGVKR